LFAFVEFPVSHFDPRDQLTRNNVL